jgi:ubiquinone/menaquinone biosynthesis C-methylase UbiE
LSERFEHRRSIQKEFARAAPGFAERTRGRFDDLHVVEFSRLGPGESVCEVGAGTGNFLSLFSGHAGWLVAADLTPGMLIEARRRFNDVTAVCADGFRLPFRSGSIDLVTSAQTLHHIFEPVPFLREMRRVTDSGGSVLIVDQLAPESLEKATVRNQLDLLRDPTHAASRPASAFRIVMRAAGLEIVDERVVESRSRLSKWMWPGEFPAERIAAVREFIERYGDQTGMDWQREGDDWTFARHRIMLLAHPAA